MNTQINFTCKSCWSRLCNIVKISFYLTNDHIKTIIHAYVTSKLDNFNSLLSGSSQCLLDKLHHVQNAAARLITKSKKFDHITPLLIQLHWMPVKFRIEYKILPLVFKILKKWQPIYIADLLSIYKPSRSLRSSNDPLVLCVPKTRLVTYGDHSFSAIAPVLWNELPLSVRSSSSLNIFKSTLKTYLFKKVFNL